MARRTSLTYRRKSPEGQLPIEIEARPSWFGAVIGVFFGGIFLVVAYNFLDQGIARQGMALVVVGVAAVAGLWAALSGVLGLLKRQDIRIDGTQVAMTQRGLLGTKTWTEPLSSYEGVRWRRFLQSNHSDDSDRDKHRHIHVIDLSHPDSSKDVTLFRELVRPPGFLQAMSLLRDSVTDREPTDEERAEIREKADRMARTTRSGEPREVWEGYARLLGLPAIDERDGAREVRAAEDVDKSLRQLADEGRLEETEWAETPAPRPLEVERAGDPSRPETQELRVRLHATEVPVWVYGAFVGMGVLLLLSSLFSLDGGGMLFGLIFVGAGAGVWYLERRNPREVRISREEITYIVPNVESRGFSVPLSEIESVQVRDVQGAQVMGRSVALFGGQLSLSTDRGERRLAGGLPRDALDWLKRYVTSAIATA
ncbi:hypothetical protein [Histidinibacterium aquaticum]|uniref:Uncharacterized protein n=1 Tax=Histidinibacterium aquaticum TaxID=2613962 RepID=A0A5J5GSQ0_9RHOB|nr:hypothetical protein [Histidinibacterium aquaticum]KAA9010648.1 hypothetical protein F3S47_05270 [Histidinibacterium aquaticum]